ncbi:MAG: HAD family phosphatase [Clostridia bacterium]|nr:HAD family phosphatase [Clostridia bacterium]
MKIKGAIFDMDGTLINSLTFFPYFWRSIGIKYKNDPSFRPAEEIDKGFRTMVFKQALIRLKDFYRFPGEAEELFRFADDCLRSFYRDGATVKPGAFALLDHLKSKKIPLVLASATAKAEVCFALSCHGLLNYFEDVFSCADLGKGKEHPDVYRAAIAKMGLSPSEVCVFEDSFVALETAKKEGFLTAGIYDAGNFDQERLKASADVYLEEGKPLSDLIPCVE